MTDEPLLLSCRKKPAPFENLREIGRQIGRQLDDDFNEIFERLESLEKQVAELKGRG